jgi:hypothetical protein
LLSGYGNSVTVSGSGTVDLNSPGLPNLIRNGGTVNYGGLLADSMLALDSSTGSWNFDGEINGGTITSSNGAQLICSSGSVLDGVTLGPGSPLGFVVNQFQSSDLEIVNGLTLTNTTINLGGEVITAVGAQTWTGTGTITIGAGGSLRVGDDANVATSVGNLTFSPNLEVVGTGSISNEFSHNTITNAGTIAADTTGGTLTLVTNGGVFSNTGTIEASNGGTLALQGDYAAQSQGSVDVGIGSGGAGTVAVSGAANLAGTLNIGLVNNFVPPVNQTYNLLTYASSGGAFTTINLPTAPGVAFTATAGATALTLATSSPPPPTVAELIVQVSDDRVEVRQAMVQRRQTMAALIRTRSGQSVSLRTARRKLSILERENKRHASDEVAAEIVDTQTQIANLTQQLAQTRQSISGDSSTDFSGIKLARRTLLDDMAALREARRRERTGK